MELYPLGEVQRLEQESLRLNGIDMRRTTDQGDRMTGAREHAAKIATDRACAHDGNRGFFLVCRQHAYLGGESDFW